MKTQYKYIVPSILLLGAVAQVAFGTPPGSKYTPGETMDPGCSAGDVNCDVELSIAGNIYTEDGTTGTGRTVGVTDTLNFDSNTLFVDGTNNRVGIGDAAPINKLSVLGDDAEHAIKITSAAGFGISVDSKTSNPGDAVRMAFQSYRTSDGGEDFASIGALEGGLSLSGGGNTLTAPHVFVNNSGNVGIGTTSPTFPLDVAGIASFDNAVLIDGIGTAHSQLAFRDDGIGTGLVGTPNGETYLSLNASNGFVNHMVVTASGSVGIGTTTPVGKLDVEGIGYFGTDNHIRLTDSNNGGNVVLYDKTAGTGKYLYMVAASPAHANEALIGGVGTGIHFETFSSGAGDSELYISGTNGKIGIGTMAPTEKLTVDGKVLLTSSFSSTVGSVTYESNTDRLFLGDNSGSSANGAAISIQGDTNTDLGAGTEGSIIFNAGDKGQSMLIQGTTGNVGIGTMAPGSKLSVVGLPTGTSAAATTGGTYQGAVCIDTAGDMYVDTDGTCN